MNILLTYFKTRFYYIKLIPRLRKKKSKNRKIWKNWVIFPKWQKYAKLLKSCKYDYIFNYKY